MAGSIIGDDFAARKRKILAQLAVPDAEYTDASPKGTVDAGIRDLIDELNGLDGFVTTSSCGGRVSVFVEGVKKQKAQKADDADAEDDDDAMKAREEAARRDGDDGEAAATAPAARPAGTTLAAIGGKGGGGNWLFVSHDPVVITEANGDQMDLKEVLGLKNSPEEVESEGSALKEDTSSSMACARLIHFKFEPMILHVLAASPAHAQLLLRCGLQAGFRESGAINLTTTASAGSETTPTPMVAIRCMGLTFESLVGMKEGDRVQCTVTPAYLRTLVDIGNERFAENTRRIQRFRSAVLEAVAAPPASGPRLKGDGSVWEDAEARRERKEGRRVEEEGCAAEPAAESRPAPGKHSSRRRW
ncbi:methyltransferase TYW3-domain-containing protein [Apiospora phragmitis]|uniref:tRNA(Phe) 7-[(3-amino-3-carboxypropyl)-4-demethylwyosine(37)-N(4)]-methyltransferase n=1 Tax=Apiospora phragmitis TaxID=2905665 RepID=A0ABR1VVB6_9PEZI